MDVVMSEMWSGRNLPLKCESNASHDSKYKEPTFTRKQLKLLPKPPLAAHSERDWIKKRVELKNNFHVKLNFMTYSFLSFPFFVFKKSWMRGDDKHFTTPTLSPLRDYCSQASEIAWRVAQRNVWDNLTKCLREVKNFSFVIHPTMKIVSFQATLHLKCFINIYTRPRIIHHLSPPSLTLFLRLAARYKIISIIIHRINEFRIGLRMKMSTPLYCFA